MVAKNIKRPVSLSPQYVRVEHCKQVANRKGNVGVSASTSCERNGIGKRKLDEKISNDEISLFFAEKLYTKVTETFHRCRDVA